MNFFHNPCFRLNPKPQISAGGYRKNEKFKKIFDPKKNLARNVFKAVENKIR